METYIVQPRRFAEMQVSTDFLLAGLTMIINFLTAGATRQNQLRSS
jgi:hypothetical protein